MRVLGKTKKTASDGKVPVLEFEECGVPIAITPRSTSSGQSKLFNHLLTIIIIIISYLKSYNCLQIIYIT